MKPTFMEGKVTGDAGCGMREKYVGTSRGTPPASRIPHPGFALRPARSSYSEPMRTPFLFSTGIENGHPATARGHRAGWREDFALVRELGVTAVRYGPAYHQVHVAPGAYDWATSDEPMHH